MTAKFWVGGTGTWDNSLTLNWSLSSGGLPGAAAPTSGDTATFDASSGGGTVTVNADINVTSITMGAFTGTLDFSANNNSPTLSGSFSASGTGTRTLNLGSGTFTCASWSIATTTNGTWSLASSTIILTAAAATFAGGNLAYGRVSFTGGGAMALTGTNGGSMTSFNITGVGAGDSMSMNTGLVISGAFTVTGSSGANPVLIKSNSAGTIRIVTIGNASSFTNTTWSDMSVTFSASGGTWTLNESLNLATTSTGLSTLTLTQGTFNASTFNVTAGVFSSSNSNTRTLTMGSGTWTLTGNATTIWDTGTITGLTFTATTAIIKCSYSGATGTRTFSIGPLTGFPTLQITAGTDIFKANTSGSGTFGSIDFTGFSGSAAGGTGTSLTMAGDLTLSSTMTTQNTDTTHSYTFSATSGTQTITSNGVIIYHQIIKASNASSTLSIADDLNINVQAITVNGGTFTANNKNITCGSFSSSNSNTRVITMGSGTWTLTGTGTVWTTATTTGLTLNKGTSTIKINDSSASSKTFASGTLSFYNLYLTGGGSGTMIIGTATSTLTFNGITVDPPLTVQVFAGSTLVLSSPTLLISGNGGQINTFQSTTNGQTWTISSATGTFNENYISLQDSIATGGGTFYAGAQSISVSGNTGWIFTDAPDQNQNANRDSNMVPAMLAISSEDGETVIPVYADANSHALFVMPF